MVSINHVGFRVKDIYKSIDFYCKNLGGVLSPRFKIEENVIPRLVFIDLNESQSIELFSGATERLDLSSETIGYAHLCILLDDAAAACELWKKNGVVFANGPRLNANGKLSGKILDPDGNEIEFKQA